MPVIDMCFSAWLHELDQVWNFFQTLEGRGLILVLVVSRAAIRKLRLSALDEARELVAAIYLLLVAILFVTVQSIDFRSMDVYRCHMDAVGKTYAMR